jgi:hypothetical protein
VRDSPSCPQTQPLAFFQAHLLTAIAEEPGYFWYNTQSFKNDKQERLGKWLALQFRSQGRWPQARRTRQ